MFTNFTLNSEIARQRQSVLITRSDRHRASRRPAPFVAETCGSLIDLPAPRVYTATTSATTDSLVA